MNPPFGLFDQEWAALMQRVTRELVQYTPEHFKVIHCEIRMEVEVGARRVFYRIVCPDYPDEWTDKPGDALHAATSTLIQYWLQHNASFPGMRIVVEIQPDNSMRNRFELLRTTQT